LYSGTIHLNGCPVDLITWTQNDFVSPQVIISIHKTRTTISITLKPTTMKRLNSICISMSCLFIILLSISCKKDSFNADPPPCTTCDTLTISTMLINDSNWVRQDNWSYTSDLTWIIIQSGAAISQVHEIYISSNNNTLQEIFPGVSANYMDGTIYGSVDLTKDYPTCKLTFASSNEEHEGEVHPISSLPFKSVEIEVILAKPNN
jgi:hypothetical protein